MSSGYGWRVGDTEPAEESSVHLGSMAVRGGVAGFGAAAGLVVAGPAGVVVGAVGSQMAVDMTGALWQRLGKKRQERASVPILYAAAATNQPIDELTELLADDPAFEQIVTTVLVGAVSTQMTQKLIALGRILANVVEDPAKVDEEQFLALALNAVEAPHLRLLDALDRQQTVSGQVVSQESLGSLNLGESWAAVLKTLESSGLIWNQPVMRMVDGPSGLRLPHDKPPEKVPQSRPHWGVTDLGKTLMNRLRDVAAELGDEQ